MADKRKGRGKAKKRVGKVESTGVAHIKATFNNTIITITDTSGGVVSWASAGTVGFKGSKKSTPFAAQLAATNTAKEAMDLGMRKVEVWVKGPGAGREAAIRDSWPASAAHEPEPAARTRAAGLAAGRRFTRQPGIA